jgi:2-iminobutanoate/2-iminopropanoate deaminase
MMKQILIATIACLLAGCQKPALDRETISTEKAPAAIGPYSQAIKVGGRLYLSGQIGIDPATGQIVDGGVEGQTHQTLKNLGAILESAGFGFDDVVQAQVFLADLNDYATVNAVYKTYFDESFPARAAVQVARLPRDARVEIMMVSARK